MITQSLILQVVLGIGLIVLLLALVFLVRGVAARSALRRQPYDVGRQQARQKMQVAFTRAFLALIVAFLVLGTYGVFARPAPFFPAPTPLPPTPAPTTLPTATTAVVAPTPTHTVTPLPQPPTVAPTPTSPVVPVVESSPTVVPTSPLTNTEFVTATVNSPLVGLYLRDVPGGTQELELLPDGLVLILLAGTATANELEWQEVQSPSGNVGWVAVPYILYGTTRPPEETP